MTSDLIKKKYEDNKKGGNQNLYIEERQTTQWTKEKGQTNTPQKTGDEIICFKIKYDKLEKVDLVITDTPAFQILNEAMKGMRRTLNIIRKPRKSLFSKRKRAITQER